MSCQERHRKRSQTTDRIVLSDFNEFGNLSNRMVPASINLDNSSCSDSSSDDSDKPVVKRMRKTRRKVYDSSRIISSENVKVYSTIAQESFDEINSTKIDFIKFHEELIKDSARTKESETKQRTRSQPENDDDDIIIVDEHFKTVNSVVDNVADRSPPPPSPPPPSPPPLTVKMTKRTCTKNQHLNKINSNIKKLDNALNSANCDSADNILLCLDDFPDVGDDDDKDDRKIVVMVKCGIAIKRFPMNYNDTFFKMFSQLSEEQHVPEDQLMLLLKDSTIHQNETPASIKLQVSDIIDCLIAPVEDDINSLAERSGPDIIRLVVQSSINQRSKVVMQIGKFEALLGMIDLYAKQHKLKSENFKLYFDGELIKGTQTPADLDMEDGDCLDLVKS